MTLKKEFYTARKDLLAFYGSIIKKGTKLYPAQKKEKGIFHHGKFTVRFVFDTIKGAQAHGYNPDENIRISIWAYKGEEWEDDAIE